MLSASHADQHKKRCCSKLQTRAHVVAGNTTRQAATTESIILHGMCGKPLQQGQHNSQTSMWRLGAMQPRQHQPPGPAVKVMQTHCTAQCCCRCCWHSAVWQGQSQPPMLQPVAVECVSCKSIPGSQHKTCTNGPASFQQAVARITQACAAAAAWPKLMQHLVVIVLGAAPTLVATRHEHRPACPAQTSQVLI